MKLYIKDQLIDIELLRDLKSKFTVVFEDDKDIPVKLDGDIISIHNVNIDCSHWLERIKAGNTNLKLSELIDMMLIEFSSAMDVII